MQSDDIYVKCLKKTRSVTVGYKMTFFPETRRMKNVLSRATYLTKVWRVTLVNEAESFVFSKASFAHANLPLRANNPPEYCYSRLSACYAPGSRFASRRYRSSPSCYILDL